MRPPLREDFSDSDLAEGLPFIGKLAKILPKEEKNQKTRGVSPAGLSLGKRPFHIASGALKFPTKSGSGSCRFSAT
jgi:hypothetical protein